MLKKDAYSSPRTDDALEASCRAKIFTAMDFRSRYWKIPMDPSSIDKTAFVAASSLEFSRLGDNR